MCNSNTKYASNEVRTHLNLLNYTRQAYVSAESSDRIKRALKAHIFTSEAPFYYGEKVFYWKESQDKASRGWKGPATIIGSEVKVIVVRHETKVRRTSEGSALSKVNKTENTATPLVFPIAYDTDSSGVTNQNEDTINTPLNRNMPVTVTPERKSADDITADTNTSLETERNIPILESPSTVSKESNTETRVLRPRSNIKPASKYGFDELYEVSDEVNIAKMKELNRWNMHQVYKEVEVSDDEVNIAKMEELNSWNMHQVYKEVEVSDDEVNIAKMKELNRWNMHQVYKEVEVSDDEVNIAKMKELNSWNMHQVYKEVEVSDES